MKEYKKNIELLSCFLDFFHFFHARGTFLLYGTFPCSWNFTILWNFSIYIWVFSILWDFVHRTFWCQRNFFIFWNFSIFWNFFILWSFVLNYVKNRENTWRYVILSHIYQYLYDLNCSVLEELFLGTFAVQNVKSTEVPFAKVKVSI